MSVLERFRCVECLLLLCLCCGCSDDNNIPPKRDYNNPETIAHRGYWNRIGGKENTVEGLIAAIELGVYGCEIDIHETSDGVFVVCHDALYNGVNIAQSPFVKVQDLPVLDQFLEVLQTVPTFKLVIEIKEVHSLSSLLNLIDCYNVTSQIDFISFSADYCLQLIAINSMSRVAYLNGGIAPRILHNLGYTGIAYPLKEYQANPTWVSEAHALGLDVYVWTVNGRAQMMQAATLGVDFIITDTPQIQI